jgi:hypothetical protein
VELWNLLKSGKLEGRKFRRQHSIGIYIVDFCCPSENLIIGLMEILMENITKLRKTEKGTLILKNLDLQCLGLRIGLFSRNVNLC